MPDFGKRELEIMQILWHGGPQTAKEVREQIKDPVADPTVRTMLRILEGKKAVSHTKRGRAFVYKADVPMRETAVRMIKDIVSGFFKGNAEELVKLLREESMIQPKELERAKRTRPKKKSRKK